MNHPLAQKHQLGPYSISNRIAMASMTRNRGLLPTRELHGEYYAARASAGLIFSEHLLIEPQGSVWPLSPILNNDQTVDAWRDIIAYVKQRRPEVIFYAQLWHAGRCAHPLMQCGLPCVGPSAIQAKGGQFRYLRRSSVGDETPITYAKPEAIEDPRHYVELYRSAAQRALQAGFDGVELHGASGFLVNQFLDTRSNQRQDEWGGSAENRCRFPLAVMDALISVFGADRVGIKISPAGTYNDVGMPLAETRETYTLLMRELRQRAIAHVQVQRFTEAMDHPKVDEEAFDVRELRAHFAHPGGSFILNGGFDVESASAAIKNGDCDMVSFASYFITNPDLSERIFDGRELKKPDFNKLYGDYFSPELFAQGYTDLSGA